MDFKSIQDLIQLAEEKKTSIGSLVLDWEAETAEKPREEIWSKMNYYWQAMKQSMEEGTTQDIRSVTGLTGGDAKLMAYTEAKIICESMKRAVARAMAVAEVNAAMKKIVAAPTGGSSGIIPAALSVAVERLEVSEDKVVQAMFTAAAIGMVIANNASISGAEGGCQAECGVASAMASSAIVELAGGTPEQVGHAAAISLKNILGLVCDPVAGLVEVPCIKRNVIGVVNALVSAEMALAGIRSVIPIDEVISALEDVSKRMAVELRETAGGGLATTPTGRRIRNEVQKKI